MSENTKTSEFLQKLAPCLQRSDPDACAEEAARLAREMGVGAQELLDLSSYVGLHGIYVLAYVLALAAAQGLEGTAKAGAYCNAGAAAGFLGKKENQEQFYKQAIAANPNLAEAHGAYGHLLIELDRRKQAWKETEKSSGIFEETGQITMSHSVKAWFYEKYAEKKFPSEKISGKW